MRRFACAELLEAGDLEASGENGSAKAARPIPTEPSRIEFINAHNAFAVRFLLNAHNAFAVRFLLNAHNAFAVRLHPSERIEVGREAGIRSCTIQFRKYIR
jgi:hypothetical protein